MTVICPDRVWMPDEPPSAKVANSMMLIHPPYLRLADVECALFEHVLLERPRELGLPWCDRQRHIKYTTIAVR